MFMYKQCAYLCETQASKLARQTDALFSQWNHKNSPGCAVAVLANGIRLFEGFYGAMNLDYQLPIERDTIFRVASLAKQFTAAAIALLEQDGKISLEENIQTYLPEFRGYDTPLTLRHLMYHTSGLREMAYMLWGLQGLPFGDRFNQAEVLDLLTRQPHLRYQPGTKFMYCNSGYFLLGVLVERVSGQSLAEFCQERIFQPLGMSNTHFHDDDTRIVRNRAIGYTSASNDEFRIYDMPSTTLVGDDGLFTTLEDLILWDGSFYNNSLGLNVAQKMLTPGCLDDGSPVEYGYGLFLDKFQGLKRHWAFGEFLGFHSMLSCCPEKQFSVIILGNTDALPAVELAEKISEIYLAELNRESGEIVHNSSESQSVTVSFKSAQEQASVQFPLRHKRHVPLSLHELQAKIGVYYNPGTGSFWEVLMDNGGLLVDINKSIRSRLAALDKELFVDLDLQLDTDRILRFEPAGEEKPQKILVEQGELRFVLNAVEPAFTLPELLSEYVGEYTCKDLATTYRITLQGSELAITNTNPHRVFIREPLLPLAKDRYRVTFSLWKRNIRFEREVGVVSGFTVLDGMEHDFYFAKV